MRMQRRQQVAGLLGPHARVLLTERVDDGAFLLGPRVTRGRPEVVDRPLPRQGTHRGSRWGWTAGRGRASRLTAGDPRNVSGATSRQGLPHTLRRLPAPVSAPLAVRDDRGSPRRHHWRQPTSGPQSERAVPARRMALEDWPPEGIRGEAPTVSGEHAGSAGGWGPWGQRTEAPTRPQSPVRRGALAHMHQAIE